MPLVARLSRMVPWVLLLLQAILAAVTIDVLRRRVFRQLKHASNQNEVIAVWAPIIVIVPMMFFLGKVEFDIREAGWITVGGPVMCGMLGLGLGLTVRNHSASPQHDSQLSAQHTSLIWIGTAIMLILLTAAGELTLWMGQCAFAIAAILLWLNSPPVDRGEAISDAQLKIGYGITIAVLCAVGHGVITLFIPEALAHMSGGIAMVTAAMTLCVATRMTDSSAAIHLGCWSAVYGMLFGMGIISIIRLVPETIQTIQTGISDLSFRLVTGYGGFAIEGVLFLIVAIIAAGHRVLRRRVRFTIGFTLIVLAAVVTLMRLAP